MLQKSERTFGYYENIQLLANEEYSILIPKSSINKKTISDIGWQADAGVKVYATIAEKIDANTIWEEVKQNEKINKTVTALKFVNTTSNSGKKIFVRVIFE